jgi:hypothetical protein
MEYPIRCDCGQLVSVPEAAAGSSVTCPCGRDLAVPSLSELKRQVGFAAYKPPPQVIIQHLLAAGELPPPACLGCGSNAGRTINTVAECERAWTKGTGIPGWIPFLFFLPFGWIVLRVRRGETVHGEDLIVPVPVRLCPSCRRRLPRRRALTPLRFLKFAMLILGVVLLVFSACGGALVVATGLFLWWLEALTRRGEQERIKSVLRPVPVYGELLERYPDARVIVNDDA